MTLDLDLGVRVGWVWEEKVGCFSVQLGLKFFIDEFYRIFHILSLHKHRIGFIFLLVPPNFHLCPFQCFDGSVQKATGLAVP